MFDDKVKAALLLALVTVICYSNSLGGEFVFDDQYFVVKNITIRNIANFGQFFTRSSSIAFADLAKDVYRPLTAFSYALDYLLWRFDTFGYHLTNLAMHCANALLVFFLALALMESVAAAFFAALIFAVHPVQTEAVSWISGRSSVMCMFFYLSALLAYIRYVGTKKTVFAVCSTALYALALLSKEMAVTFPLIVASYDIHFGNREGPGKRMARYLPYIGITLVFLIARSVILQRISQCGWWADSPYYTMLTMSTVFAKYLGLLIFPLNLCAFYKMDIYTSLSDPMVMVSIPIFIAVLLSVPLLFRKNRSLSFFVTWFLVALLPVSNIVPLKALMAERFLYIPSIGFAAALSAVLFKFRKEISVTLAAIVVVLYGSRTYARNEDWKDAVSISSSIVKVSPLNSWGWTTLGTAYLAQGQNDKAQEALKKAISIAKDYATPWNALGFCYLEKKEYAAAVSALEESLRLDPDNVETLNSIGMAYSNTDAYVKAEDALKKAIAIDPSFVSAYLNLGAIHERQRQYDKALVQYVRIEKVTTSAPDIAISYLRIADVRARTGDEQQAAIYYNKALGLCGGHYPDLRQVIEERFKNLKVPRRESQ